MGGTYRRFYALKTKIQKRQTRHGFVRRPPIKKQRQHGKGTKKVGTIDGEPVFDNKNDALKHAEEKGCTGFHTHKLEGETAYGM